MIKSKIDNPKTSVNTYNREFKYRTYICKLCKVEFVHIENYDLHLKNYHKAKQKSIFNCCETID